MARKPRLTFEGAIHHVTFRGNERQAIFTCDADRVRFLDSLAERIDRYEVRLYLYCLMTNHVHLLLETPRGNLSAFMGSLLTSYTTYFNRRTGRSGHLTQGRYNSPLVSKDEYLLRLSRYIHLNPVFVEGWERVPVGERIKTLRNYRWSSYRGYAGIRKKEEWVDNGPLLAMMPGRGERVRQQQFRAYVEEGLVETDEEMEALSKTKGLGIGSEDFIAELRKQHERLMETQIKREDVSFRRIQGRVSAERILQGVCEEFQISRLDMRRQRLNDRIKPVAAVLLTTVGGLTQRDAAELLGLRTGAAVCLQLKRAKAMEHEIKKVVHRVRQGFNI
jgi:putative transposase